MNTFFVFSLQIKKWSGRYALAKFTACLLFLIVVNLSASLLAWGQNSPPTTEFYTTCTTSIPIKPITLCLTEITDPDGDAWQVTEVHSTFDCSLKILNDNCVKYTPLPGLEGVDTVKITVCDKQTPPACSESIILVYLGCYAPKAVADEVLFTKTGVIFNGSLLNANNNYNDGAYLAVTQNDDAICEAIDQIASIVKAPEHGSFSIQNGVEVFYKPTTNYYGTDVFEYVVCTNTATCNKCDTTLVNITIQEPDAPCNTDLYECITQTGSVDICPAFCTLQPNEITKQSATTKKGIVNQPVLGCATYFANPFFTGIDTVVFIACNAANSCDTTLAIITIDPNCGTNPPVAVDDQATTDPNVAVTIYALKNDYDLDGNTFSINKFTQPANGVVTKTADGFLYLPNPDFIGQDFFTYTICDANNICDDATVTIYINQPCTNYYEYCTPKLTPVTFCAAFCNIADSESKKIIDASTTFNCSLHILSDTCIKYIPLPGFEGVDTVTIIACDTPTNICDTVKVEVNVGCIKPTVVDDAVEINTAQTPNASIPVLNNDFDFCGYNLEPTIILNPKNGIANVNADGTIKYTPNSNYIGTDVLQYIACSDCNKITPKCDTGTVTIKVVHTASQTDAKPDVVTTTLNTPLTIDVKNNDVFEAPGTITLKTAPMNGWATVQPNGSINYVPKTGYAGTDAFVYILCNSDNVCDEALVSITVLDDGSNKKPNAINDVANTDLNTEVIINIMGNDNDPEGDVLTLPEIIEVPKNGQLTINPDGSATYKPNNGYIGTDQFTYKVCDQQGLCDDAVVVIAIGQPLPNDAPIANDDVAAGAPNEYLTINILSNDTDPNPQDKLTPSIVLQPQHGTATIDPLTHNLVYLPAENYQGPDAVTYMVCDNGLPSLCDTAYVQISVGSVNDAPIAVNDTAFTVVNLAVSVLVLENDMDTDNDKAELTITIITPPANGSTKIIGQLVVYTPNADYMGNDIFTYSVCDPLGACDTAIAFIYMTEKPNAFPDIYYTLKNNPVSFDPILNDTGEMIYIKATEKPTHGKVVENPDGTLTYTPNPDYIGSDYFIYEICDPTNNCDKSLVTVITLNPDANEPPVTVNDLYQTNPDEAINLDVLANDADPENEPLTLSNLNNPSNGNLQQNGNLLIYTPNPGFTGEDIFTYDACDPQGLCTTAMVVVLVGDGTANTPPTANDDVKTTLPETPVNIELLNNDTDPDAGQTLSVTFITKPVNGSSILQPNGTVKYYPNIGFEGNDYFVYTVCDNGNPSLCDTAYVTIYVVNSNQNIDIYAETPEDTDIELCIDAYMTLPFVSDTIIVQNMPQNGFPYFQNNANNCITYSPNANYKGNDEWVIIACDETLTLCDTININIKVLPTPDAPTANPDEATLEQDTEILIDVLPNDTDPDGDVLTVDSITQPTNGQVVIENGQVKYTPNPGFIGIDTFTYTIKDENDSTATTTVIVTVTEKQPSSVIVIAEDDSVATKINKPIDIEILENDTYNADMAYAVQIFADPINGIAEFDPITNLATYTPYIDFIGIDSFKYMLCIGDVFDKATVIVNITKKDQTNGGEDTLLAIPNGISPNGDNINDELIIDGLDNYDNVNLFIVNRWGDAVYKIANYNNNLAWKGQWLKNNSPVPDGTYYLVLELIKNGQAPEKRSAFVEVVR